MRATEQAQQMLAAVLQPGDWAVDATVGNGHDTHWLAAQVGATGRVFGFDVQADALATARARLVGCEHVSLIHAGHESMRERLPAEASGRIGAVMFNLGYLPGGDKSLVTQPETTLSALSQALDLLRPRGMITLVLYPGHAGGAAERDKVVAVAARLPSTFTVQHMRNGSAVKPAPEVLVIARLR